MESENLGRGLSALIPDKIKQDFAQKSETGETEISVVNTDGIDSPASLENKNGVILIELRKIIPNINQPRQNFKEEPLDSLMESIKEYGLLQPIVVAKKEAGIYEIIAGERRFKASKLAGLKEIPAIIREVDELSKLELALTENIQRENLNPIEEGKAYQRLIKDFQLTQEDISQKIKRSRSSIANLLRFLRLPEEIQQGLIDNKIGEGHAKILSALDDPEAQLALYKKTVRDNLTVRDVENITSKVNVKSHQRKLSTGSNPMMAQREKILSDALGLKVQIRTSKKGGKVILEYYNENDLDRLIQLVSKD
ncbi:MAG: ParB/RepB/Spo0J family partition protein [Patescibacteria group bacterium]|nr:ParB/RepB/Spo0J family partition protein [Patescibacteria group bacterium]